jgi:peptidoglycan-N-acetylglucosamine deacetylase
VAGAVTRLGCLAALVVAIGVLPLARAMEPESVPAGIVTHLAVSGRSVALTFDACEAGRPAHLDHGITDYLVEHRIPFTVFMGGRFARDNAADVRTLAAQPFVSIQNHTWSHPTDLRLLADDVVRGEVTRAADEIRAVTGRRTNLFRFPGGHADDRTVALVESLGYRVVHWRWPEGDPTRSIDADMLVAQTMARTRPGDILIFHVNGRGWHTAEALPRIVEGLTARGYAFVPLEGNLPPR